MAGIGVLVCSYAYAAVSARLVPMSADERKRHWNVVPLRLILIFGLPRVALTLAGYYE